MYLAELLFANPQCSVEFAKVFNNTFTLFKDNLGTFGHIIKDENEKYDYILSNPPYVTRGSSIIKEEISKTPHTAKEYPINALGLEGISLEWIVKSLKKGGKSFLIIPDGILGRKEKKLRDYILRECYLDAIVSLPVRTFFANSEHTYILAITKKHNTTEQQTEPVFTYIVSNIGEKLTSVKREEIDENDLPEMENLFKIFSGAKNVSKKLLEEKFPRCKIQAIEHFKTSHWVIDRSWTKDEKVALQGNSGDIVTKEQIEGLVKDFQGALKDYEKHLVPELSTLSEKEVSLGDEKLFKLFIGDRMLKKDLHLGKGSIPLYSANVKEPFGLVEKTHIKDFSHPSVIWSIDGNFEFGLIPANQSFSTTDHCGTIQILNKNILPEFLLYALNVRRVEESFDRSFRASLANMRQFKIKVPVNKKGDFDLDKQQELAEKFVSLQEKKTALQKLKTELDTSFQQFVEFNSL
jgi:type I restriction-modification system DNA methylase subunit